MIRTTMVLLSFLLSAPLLAQLTPLDETRIANARQILLITNDDWQEALHVYTEDAVYEEVIVKVEGKDEIRRFFSNMFANADITLEITDEAYQGNTYFGKWIMKMNYKLVGSQRKLFTVEGASMLKFREGEEKIYDHREFYNEASIYDKLPGFKQLFGMLRKTYIKRMGEDAAQP